MATRRSRIVIKPNIRPAAKSSAAAAKAKATTPNTPSDTAAQSVKGPSSLPPSEDVSQALAHQDDGKGRKDLSGSISEIEISQPSKTITGPSLKEDSPDLALDSNQNASSGANEEISAKSSEQEIKDTTSQPEEVTAPVRNTLGTKSTLINPTLPTNNENQPTDSGSVPPTTVPVATFSEPKDVTDSSELQEAKQDKVQDNVELTPSEVDVSCMSEAMSLELEEERRGDVDDEVQKKPRRRRTKKPRNEPLPSREKSPDRQKMKMSDLLSWNPQQNFLQTKTKKKSVSATKEESRSGSPSSITVADDDKEASNQSASLPAPQVMIGPDGNIVLNTESLLIHTPQDDSKPKEIIEEDDDDRYLNTNSYRKYKKTKLWTERETEKFFLGLSMCGTDFSLLTNLLPSRSRRELKNKFRREERRNRHLIDKALANKQHYDPAPFKRMDIEDDIKAKKDLQKTQKRVKKESVPAKKAEKIPKRKRGRKRKNSVSEEEEDDWGPEYDAEDEENVDDNHEETKEISIVKHRKTASKATPKAATYGPKAPNLSTESKQVPAHNDLSYSQDPSQIPQYTDSDLDTPRMRGKPKRNYSKFGSENSSNQVQATDTSTTTSGSIVNNNSNNYNIQTIPGSSQVQIEMEGVQTPVQGVLIPSHMVPQIAPQLGIQGNSAGMQVLLVQEETDSGSLVHVYVIPEGEKSKAPAGNVNSSPPALTSPIPSPHPTTPIHNPPQYIPFPSLTSPGPHNPTQNSCSTAAMQNPGQSNLMQNTQSQTSMQSPPALQQQHQQTTPVLNPHLPPAVQNPQHPIQSPSPLEFYANQLTGPILTPQPGYQAASSSQSILSHGPKLDSATHLNAITGHNSGMNTTGGGTNVTAHMQAMKSSLQNARPVATNSDSNVSHTLNTIPQTFPQAGMLSSHTTKQSLPVSKQPHLSQGITEIVISNENKDQIPLQSSVHNNTQSTSGVHSLSSTATMANITVSPLGGNLYSDTDPGELDCVVTASSQSDSGLIIDSSVENSGKGEDSDDCVVLNASKPESQIDVSAMSRT